MDYDKRIEELKVESFFRNSDQKAKMALIEHDFMQKLGTEKMYELLKTYSSQRLDWLDFLNYVYKNAEGVK